MKYAILWLTFFGFFITGCDSNQPASTNTVNNKTATVLTAPEKAEAQLAVAPAAQAERTTPAITSTAPAEQVVQKVALSGEQVYKKSCINCHGTGVAGAPKMGDAAAWSIRTAKGIEVLYNSTRTGVPGTAMMARGTCSACSETELHAAVDYMIAESK